MKNPTKELMAIPPEDWLEEADRRERAGDKQGAKTAREFARFLMGHKDAFENPVKSRKENYNDFNEWETDAFRAGATQVVRLGENLFSAIKMKDGSLVKLDEDGFVDMRSRAGQMVRRNSTTVGSWYGERGEINRQLVAKSGKSRPYENPAHRSKESPLYVKYLSLMRGEEPFMMQGTKYEYVWAEYPGGIKDIGVYSYANDLVYSYDSFRSMMNLPNPAHRRNMGEGSMPKQRIGISLSKNRRRNPVYDTGSDE